MDHKRPVRQESWRALRAMKGMYHAKRVERLMREAGVRVSPKARFVVTTESNHDQPMAPKLLEQDFIATAPNCRRVTDITYVHIEEE